MHLIQFRPDPARGPHSTPPDPLGGFKGYYFWGKRGEKREKGRRGRRKEREVKGVGGRVCSIAVPCRDQTLAAPLVRTLDTGHDNFQVVKPFPSCQLSPGSLALQTPDTATSPVYCLCILRNRSTTVMTDTFHSFCRSITESNAILTHKVKGAVNLGSRYSWLDPVFVSTCTLWWRRR